VLSLFEEINAPSLDDKLALTDAVLKNKQLRHLYAKSFVYALDTISQLVRVISELDQLPIAACDQCEIFLTEFDSCRDIRNSFQHIEDRLRGIGRNKKPIPSPILILGGFHGNCFGATTSEGKYVDIEISSATISKAETILKNLIWCFNWLGPGNKKIIRPASET
jgi:hypothetical protein